MVVHRNQPLIRLWVLEDVIMPVVDAVVEVVENAVDAITPEKIEVAEAAPTTKAESGIKDGIMVVKDGNQADNAPKGSGTVVNQPESPVGVKKPNALSRTKATMGVVLDAIIDLKPSNSNGGTGEGDTVYVRTGFRSNVKSYDDKNGEYRILIDSGDTTRVRKQ